MADTTLTDKLANKAAGTPATNTFNSLLERMKPQIQAALPKHVTVDRIARIALTAYNSNPKLRECDQTSLLAAIMISSQLGVEVNTPLGQAYIIPYKIRGVWRHNSAGLQGLLI